MAPQIKLTYFDLRGRGELSRVIMQMGHMDYVDNRIAFSEWPALKSSTMFGSMPYVEYDGETIGQSTTVARFLAKKAGLAGRNELEQAQADMIVDYIQDWFQSGVAGLYFGKDLAGKTEAAKKIFEWLPPFLDRLEGILKKNGGKHFAGCSWTYADVGVALLLDQILLDSPIWEGIDVPRKATISKYPCLSNLNERFHDIPEVKSYMQKRKPCPF